MCGESCPWWQTVTFRTLPWSKIPLLSETLEMKMELPRVRVQTLPQVLTDLFILQHNCLSYATLYEVIDGNPVPTSIFKGQHSTFHGCLPHRDLPLLCFCWCSVYADAPAVGCCFYISNWSSCDVGGCPSRFQVGGSPYLLISSMFFFLFLFFFYLQSLACYYGSFTSV